MDWMDSSGCQRRLAHTLAGQMHFADYVLHLEGNLQCSPKLQSLQTAPLPVDLVRQLLNIKKSAGQLG